MKLGVLVTVIFIVVLSTCVIADSGKLEIDHVEIDGKRFSGSGTAYIKPHEEMNFEVTVKNMWDKDNDDKLHINDIRVKAILYDIDDDLTYTSSMFDLRPEGYKTIRFDFDIPSDVSGDRNYDLLVYAEGTDETGEKEYDELELNAEVERDDHDVNVDMDVGNPSPCGDIAKVYVKLENEGIYDEDVNVELSNAFLGEIYSREVSIEAGEDESLSRSFDVSELGQGTHTINVVVNMDNEKVYESEELYVPYCDEKDHDTYEDRDDDYSFGHTAGKIVYGNTINTGHRSPNRYYFHTVDEPQEVQVNYQPMPTPMYVNNKLDWELVFLILANMLLGMVLILAAVVWILKNRYPPKKQETPVIKYDDI